MTGNKRLLIDYMIMAVNNKTHMGFVISFSTNHNLLHNVKTVPGCRHRRRLLESVASSLQLNSKSPSALKSNWTAWWDQDLSN